MAKDLDRRPTTILNKLSDYMGDKSFMFDAEKDSFYIPVKTLLNLE